ncbi:MAG TPA: glycosyltransferase family 39 protein [bacterium]|nr:glycosyltransferase family 39 protein [bacterium]
MDLHGSWREWAWAGGLTAVAAGVRLIGLGTAPLWTDEAFSLWMAGHSAHAIWRWTAQLDAHPPLYYLLLHSWLVFGDRTVALRALSVAAGVLTTPVAYLLGRGIGGPRLGILTALLLALSPFNLWYAQEARMYPLLMLVAAVGMWGLLLLFRDPVPRGAWTLYVAGTLLALWTEHSAALLWGTGALAILVFRRHPGAGFWRRWLAAQICILAAWTPVLVMLVRQLAAGTAGPTSLSGWGAAASLLPDTFSPLFGARPEPPAATRVLIAAFAALVTVPLLWRGLFGPSDGRLSIGVLATVWIAPVLCAVLLAAAGVSALLPATLTAGYRTLIWTSMVPCLLVGRGVLGIASRSGRAVALALVLASTVGVLFVYYRTAPKWEAWDSAAAYVAAHAAAGDEILFHDNLMQLPFDYYYRASGPAVREHGVPDDFPDRGVREPRAAQVDMPRLRVLARTSRRVWLVYSHDWWTDPGHLVPATLSDADDTASVRDFPGLPLIRVYLFQGRR